MVISLTSEAMKSESTKFPTVTVRLLLLLRITVTGPWQVASLSVPQAASALGRHHDDDRESARAAPPAGFRLGRYCRGRRGGGL